jgi:hypothetical protein
MAEYILSAVKAGEALGASVYTPTTKRTIYFLPMSLESSWTVFARLPTISQATRSEHDRKMQ